MMQSVIDKLKAAAIPSRELDRAIFDAVAGGGMFFPEYRKFWRPLGIAFREPIDFTLSIDAAITLIPDGKFWLVGYGRDRPDEPMCGAQIWEPDNQINPLGEGESPTIALAICIAALEARLSIGGR